MDLKLSWSHLLVHAGMNLADAARQALVSQHTPAQVQELLVGHEIREVGTPWRRAGRRGRGRRCRNQLLSLRRSGGASMMKT